MHGVTDFSKEAKFRGSMPRHPSIAVSTDLFAKLPRCGVVVGGFSFVFLPSVLKELAEAYV